MTGLLEELVKVYRCPYCHKHKHRRFKNWEAHPEHCFQNDDRVPWPGEMHQCGDLLNGDDPWGPNGPAGSHWLWHEGEWYPLGEVTLNDEADVQVVVFGEYGWSDVVSLRYVPGEKRLSTWQEAHRRGAMQNGTVLTWPPEREDAA